MCCVNQKAGEMRMVLVMECGKVSLCWAALFAVVWAIAWFEERRA